MKLNKEILNDEDYLSVFNKERHEEIRDGASSNMMGGKKQKVHKDSRRLDDKDWDQIFDNFLEHDKIDVPEDFYDEAIYFDSSEQLMDIYSYLEEQNLKKIKEQ